MKKIKILCLLLIIFICTACGSDVSNDSSGVKFCSRVGTIDGGDSFMNYELHYEGEYLVKLYSTEKVVSDDEELLDTYEDAYKNIFKAYEGLKYYDASVTREDGYVISEIVINYEKIDVDKLLSIEGEEDNVTFTDGKLKLDDWLDFAAQFGVECE